MKKMKKKKKKIEGKKVCAPMSDEVTGTDQSDKRFKRVGLD